MDGLLFTRTPRFFSTEVLSSSPVPSLCCCMELFFPRYLPLLNFIRFVSIHLSNLSKSFWRAAQPTGVSATPFRFVSPGNLLRKHLCLHPSHWCLSWTTLDPVLDLGDTTNARSPARPYATDYDALGSAVQPILIVTSLFSMVFHSRAVSQC